MKKVSVITPVYNGAKYIKKCLDGLCAQTYPELELIIINDGSSDETGKIVTSIDDSRIHLISLEKNGGVSAARNRGLGAATGDYIAFVDGDDETDPGLIEALVESLEKSSADMAVCGYRVIDEAGNATGGFSGEGMDDEELSTHEGFVRQMLLPGTIKCTLWNKLYVRSIIGEQRFDEGCAIGEDMLFNLEYIKKTGKVSLVREMLYGYLTNPGGAMKSINAEKHFKPKWMSEWRAAAELEREVCSWPSVSSRTKQAVFYKKLIIAHKLYYKLEECPEGDGYPDEKAAMRKLLFGSRRQIIANPYIGARWKVKLLLGKR